ncbi:MAG: MBOAT family protein [Roseburia sp.]|nr:MBOAT family protein [Roseburia sp.]MCM1097057.1 MBOAT family protein [Ruminococcus flavefaciens]
MLFTSYEFLGFLAALLILYYSVPKKFQWMLLLAASYFFYFFTGPTNLLYILGTTVTTYLAGRGIERIGESQSRYLKEHKAELDREAKKAYKAKMKHRQWICLLSCLLFNLGVLAVVKYTNFMIGNLNALFRAAGSGRTIAFWDIALPMGISFFTFQALGYLIDVYRGAVPAEKNPFRFALFVSFFPQLIQGPISRFGDLAESLFQEHSYDGKTVCFGLQRVLWGFFKKLVIADRMLAAVNTIIRSPENYSGVWVFLGMLFYALELYADFTGGIDITIGVAQALGIRVKENFIRPYFSKSIKEYWRRWHITMGTWFTDYIFYPISVCKPMLKFSKFARAHFGEKIGKRMPVYLSSFAVWFATGIWHGASWNFIVWGLANWVVIMISQELEPLYDRFHNRFDVKGKFAFRLFQVVRTVLLMSALRTFDCYRDVPLTFRMFGTMFTTFNWHVLWDGSLLTLGLTAADFAVLLCGLLLLIAVSLLQRSGSVREKIAAKPYPLRFAVWYGLFLATLLTGAYGVGYDASQFIYNQF